MQLNNLCSKIVLRCTITSCYSLNPCLLNKRKIAHFSLNCFSNGDRVLNFLAELHAYDGLSISVMWEYTCYTTTQGRKFVRITPSLNPIALLLKRIAIFSFQVFIFATCLWFLSSAINPVIYGVMNSTFRAEYKKIFALVGRSVRPSSSSLSTDDQEMPDRRNEIS